MPAVPPIFQPPAGVIARIWRAQATPAGFTAYLEHLTCRVFPLLQTIAGYRGGHVLRKRVSAPADAAAPQRLEFEVITYWESFDAIRAFAGASFERAMVEPEARAVLTEFDETVRHFDVCAVNRC
jgi:heme-degrading monooxygenase HmoA